MSLETLRADIRYQDANRELDRLKLDIADPAFSRIATHRQEVYARMKALATEHGYDFDREEWAR